GMSPWIGLSVVSFGISLWVALRKRPQMPWKQALSLALLFILIGLGTFRIARARLDNGLSHMLSDQIVRVWFREWTAQGDMQVLGKESSEALGQIWSKRKLESPERVLRA